MGKALRKVCLWNANGVLLIILEKSGIIYTNQTCGHACLHSEAEGILVPYNGDYPLDNPNLECQLSELLLNTSYLTIAQADRVDEILATNKTEAYVKVDRTRLKDSHEAWVYVTIRETPDTFLLEGFGDCKGVLTWPNSD